MGLFEHFPYANFHELNVEWLLNTVKTVSGDMDKLKAELEKIGIKIDDAVAEKLEQMLANGDFESIINDELFKIPVHAGNNIVFIGDSMTVGTGASTQSDRFSTLIANQFGMTEYNFGVGGAGFTRPNTFLDQVNRANTDMTETEKNMTSLVVILGGCNDLRWMSETGLTISEFNNAVVTCMERAKTVFPNALIVMAVGQSLNNQFTDTFRHYYYQAMTAMKQVHSEGRVLIIDHVAASINGRNDTYTSDNLHPNSKGYSMLAGFLANAILGGGTDTEYYIGKIRYDSALVTEIRDMHVFRQTENVLFGQGIIELNQAISTNTVVGTYTGAYGYDNIYIPLYHSNEAVASLGIGTTGNVRIIPYSGVTLNSGWQLRHNDHVELFRTLIG